MLQYFRKYYHIWKFAEIPHTRWCGPACSSPWTTHAATESWQTTTHHPEPHEQKQRKGWGIHMPMERLSFLPLLNPPRLPMTPPEGEEITGKYFGLPHSSGSAFTARWVMPFWRALHHCSRHSPSQHYPHHQGFLQCFQLMCLLHFQLHPSSAALSWSPTAVLTESLMPALILWRALHWQDSTQLKWAPEPGWVYRHKAVGAEPWGTGRNCTNSCRNTPQGYMQSHFHLGFFACKWFMGTRMLLYCLFKTYTNSSGYWEPTLERHGKTTS